MFSRRVKGGVRESALYGLELLWAMLRRLCCVPYAPIANDLGSLTKNESRGQSLMSARWVVPQS